MKKSNKNIALTVAATAIVIVVIIVISLLFIRNRKRKITSEKDSLLLDVFIPISPRADDFFPLKIGSTGERVRRLQIVLNQMLDKDFHLFIRQPKHQYGALLGQDLHELVVDGVFGRNTEEVYHALFGTRIITKEDAQNKGWTFLL